MERVLNGRYDLRDVVGAGGAATVYRATDRQLRRDVAVKLLDDVAARSADPGGRERFLREARTGAAVRHHNLVDIFDAGEDDGALFLVMELVSGQSLAGLIADRAPLPVDEAVRIAEEILAGLAALHGTGTIHRDVKPANVLIDEAGHVRLTDFGIAKRLDDIEGALTSDDMVVGTPTHIAPEQAAGSGLSPATDIYAVGLVLYEMLTGERAPHGGYPTSTSPTGGQVTADPRSVRPDVPDDVADVVIRATEVDPARRFADAASMSRALTAGSWSAPVRPGTSTRLLPAGFTPAAHHEPTQRNPTVAAVPTVAMQRSNGGRRAGILATVLAASVLFVGVMALAGRAAPATGDFDPPPTVPVVAVVDQPVQSDVTIPAVPLATIAPAQPPPAPADSGDRGKSDEANDGKSKGKDKKDD